MDESKNCSGKDKLLGLTKLRYETMPILAKTVQDENAIIKDPIPRILKCHLLTEVILDKLILYAYEPNGGAILAADLRYAKKLDIASRTMLVEDIPLIPDYVVGSLKKLNRIRNRLAHDLDANVTREEIIELFMGDMPVFLDAVKTDISIILHHYTGFILGNMLPKFEPIEE